MKKPLFMTPVLLASLLGGLGRPAAYADLGDRWDTRARMPVPAGAKATLEFDRREYFVGENVLAHVVLTNAGHDVFTATFGGDYRGAGRSLRFKVTAIDQDGRRAEDPHPSLMDFGGFVSEATLKPGDRYVSSLPLAHYVRIDRPGRYRVRVSHDFGWKASKHRRRPVAEATVTFRMPDARQAEQIVAEMERLPRDANTVAGKRSRDYRDFCSLSHPIYLAPLLRRAREGKEDAVLGIAGIATPGATTALLELAGDLGSRLAPSATKALLDRLPPIDATPTMDSQRRLSANAWNRGLVPKGRALAARLLTRPDADSVVLGARILAHLAERDDGPLVYAAVLRALESTAKPRRSAGDNILDLPPPLPDLLRVARILHKRGLMPGADPAGGTGALPTLLWSAVNPPACPKLTEAFASSRYFPVREAILRALPEVVPAACASLVLAALADEDLGVVRAACEGAGRSNDRAFVKPLLRIVATQRQVWLLRAAGDALLALNAGQEALGRWVALLPDKTLYPVALDYLEIVIDGLPGGHSGRTDLSPPERETLHEAWQSFLAKHAERIRQGKRFKIGDPALVPELFGRARSWDLPGGVVWPPGSRK